MAPLHAPKAQTASGVDYSGSLLQRLVVAYFLALFAFVSVFRAPTVARGEREQPGSLVAASALRVQANTSARVSRSTQRVGSTAFESEKRVDGSSSQPNTHNGPDFAVVSSRDDAMIAAAAVSSELAFEAAPSARSEGYAFLSRARAPPAATKRHS